jgi:hypothetical protein
LLSSAATPRVQIADVEFRLSANKDHSTAPDECQQTDAQRLLGCWRMLRRSMALAPEAMPSKDCVQINTSGLEQFFGGALD